MISNSKPNSSSGNNLAETLCRLTDQFREVLTKFGFTAVPRASNSLDRFNSLDESSRQKVISNFENYLNLCLEASANNIDPTDSDNSLVWWSLGRFGLRPQGDLFNQISSTDCIEIYNLENIQIFRSFNMFDCLSYSIEEIITHSWPELFRREQHYTDGFIALLGDLHSGKIKSTVFVNSEPHWVEEIFSPERRKCLISTKVVSPLYDRQKNLAAYVSTTTVHKIENPRVAPQK